MGGRETWNQDYNTHQQEFYQLCLYGGGLPASYQRLTITILSQDAGGLVNLHLNSWHIYKVTTFTVTTVTALLTTG